MFKTAFKPADLIAVVIYPMGSDPEREIIYRKTYRWRWIANLHRGWKYLREHRTLVIFKIVDVGVDNPWI